MFKETHHFTKLNRLFFTAVFLVVMTIAVMLTCSSVYAADIEVQDVTDGNIKYTLYTDGALIVEWTGGGSAGFISYDDPLPWKSEDLIDKITSVTVKNGVIRIGSRTFSGLPNCKTIVVEGSVATIQDFAFIDCPELETVVMEEGACSSVIGDYMFGSCVSLKHVTLPADLREISMRMFDGCSGLESISIPDSVTNIDIYAFNGCSKLSDVNLSDNLISIGSQAFSSCTSLTEIVIPPSVTSIDMVAFFNCTSLDSFTFGPGSFNQGLSNNNVIFQRLDLSKVYYRGTPDDFINLENFTTHDLSQYHAGTGVPEELYCLNGAGEYTLLEDLVVGSDVSEIPAYKFDGYKSLKTVTIPESVDVIGDHAFASCSNLTSVVLPQSLETLGAYAFQKCSNLTSLNIPGGITSISNGAFTECSALEEITIPDNITEIGSQAFEGCSGLKSIDFGNGVENIGADAFYKCEGLTSLTIPESVTTIGEYAFSLCSNVKSVIIRENVTSIGNRAFGISAFSTIYTVPGAYAIEHMPANSTKKYYIDGCIIDPIPDQAYTGSAVQPEVTVTYPPTGGTLTQGEDFTVTYANNTQAGEATATVVPGDTCIGELADPQQTFRIKYKISFDADGGSGQMPDVLHDSGAYTLPRCNFTAPEGMMFNAWQVGDAEYDFKDSVNISGNVTVKAVWKVDDRIGKISGANTVLSNDVTSKLYATFNEESEPTDVHMTVTMNGTATEIDAVKQGDGYVFEYKDISPENIGDEYTAVLSYTVDGQEYTDELRSYSVKEYCMSVINMSDSDLEEAIANTPTATVEEARRLMVDTLYYGAEAQKLLGHNTDSLATSELTEEQKAMATEYVSPGETEGVVTRMLDGDKDNNYYWYSAKVTLDNSARLKFFFMAPEGVDGLKVLINDEEAEIHSAGVPGKYYVEKTNIPADEFGTVIHGSFVLNGETIGQTLSYSMNTYVKSTENHASFGGMARRLYNYGRSALAYKS